MDFDVAVIGCGRVGLPLALSFADRGLRTLGVEKDRDRLRAVRDRRMPFDEPGAPQAPPRMQALGLEWAFRVAQEPGRLWRRYARYNPRFVAGFLRQYARHRLRGRPR